MYGCKFQRRMLNYGLLEFSKIYLQVRSVQGCNDKLKPDGSQMFYSYGPAITASRDLISTVK